MTNLSDDFEVPPMPRPEVGEYVDVVLGDYPPLTSGYLVADLGGQMCVQRGDWGGSYRPDQVRPAQTEYERLGHTIRGIECQLVRAQRRAAELARRPRRWWEIFREKSPADCTSTIALAVGVEALKSVRELTDQTKIPSVADEIIYETADGLSPGSTVMVTTGQVFPEVVLGKFVCEFRGRRWFTYQHGGADDKPINEVVPYRAKTRRKKVEPA